MKHLLKRVIAGSLAALMISSHMTVFADELNEVTGVNRTVSNSVQTEIVSVGDKPADVFEVILPAESIRNKIFNFYIDPNQMIRRSANALETRWPGATLGPGSLFFENRNEDGDVVGLSMDSDRLKIINKSSAPLLLELTVEMTKNGKSFDFAKTTDFKDANGKKISGPAIYLALVNGMRRAPILNLKSGSSTVYQAKLKGWIEDPQAYDVIWDDQAKAFKYEYDENISEESLPYTSFYMTGAVNGADWGRMGDVQFNVTWRISGDDTRGPDENPIPDEDTDPSVLVVTPASAIDEEALLRFDLGWGEKEKAHLQKMTYKYNGEVRELTPVTSGSADATHILVDNAKMEITVKAVTAIYKGSDWKLVFIDDDPAEPNPLEVAFDIKKATVTTNPTVTVKSGTAAKTANSEVELTLDFGSADQAMSKVTSMTYRTATRDGLLKTLEPNSEYFKLDGTSATVKAVRSIFEGSAWKINFADDEGNTYAAPFTLRDSSVRITDVKPSAKVETPVSHWNTEAGLTFKFGSGKYAMDHVDHLEYTDRTGNLITINANSGGFVVDEDAGEATVTMTIPIYAGSGWKLWFVNNDDTSPVFESVDLALLANPHDDPPQDSPPTANVTQRAGDIGDDVVIAYDLGYGPEGKAKVARLDYTSKAGGSVSVTTSSGLSIGETTVTFKATDGIYKSKRGDWRLVFTDADGSNPYSVPVDIKTSDAVEYPDQSPKIVSIKQAMDLNDPVEIIVDFGKGEDLRPIISHFEYTGENGSVALKDGGGITVSGDTVTLTATRDIYVGKNWRLGFLDSEGKNLYLLDVPLLGDGHETDIDKDPTAEVPESVQVESDGELVTKYNKARHIGDIVTVNVNYGKGLYERTKIAYLEYTVKGTDEKPDQVKQLVPDGSKLLISGNTVNVKMVKALYAAEDWKLVFADEKGGSLYPISVDLKDLENADPVPEGPSGPNITVETAAQAVNDVMTITFDRANMDKVVGVYYRNAVGGPGALAVGTKNVTLVDDNTLSITAVSAVFNGSNWAIRFSNDDGTEITDVSFNLKETGGPFYDSDPTAIVKTAVKALNATATIALTYGTGDAEKTKVIGLAFKNAAGSETTLAVGTKNVKQDGDTLTINAVTVIFNGSNWRVRFADENDSSNYTDVAVNLKGVG